MNAPQGAQQDTNITKPLPFTYECCNLFSDVRRAEEADLGISQQNDEKD